MERPEPILRGQYVATNKRIMARRMRRNPTPAESVLWKRLKGNRLEGLHFRRQQILDGFIVDFYCRLAGLVVELDGPVHDETRVYDAERTEILEGRGLRVLRFTNNQVFEDLDEVLSQILDSAEQRIKHAVSSLPDSGRAGEG